MTIHLHLDEITLDGLGGVDSESFRAAVERELARLITESDPARTWEGGEYRLVAAPDTFLSAGMSAEELGIRVAASVHAGLTRVGFAEDPAILSPGAPVTAGSAASPDPGGAQP